MKKILAISSPRSVMGVKTFEEVLSNEYTFKNLTSDQVDDELGIEGWDVIFLHNTTKVPDSLLGNSVLYALQSVVNEIENRPSLAQRIKENLPIEVWTNTRTAASRLCMLGIPANCLYRPSPKLYVPETPPDLPAEKAVFWYFKKDHPQMVPHLESIKEVMSQISDTITIYTFPDEIPPIEKDNVKALGKISMKHSMPNCRGLVRISDTMDFGRSTFDFLVQGRWVLYYQMEEDLVDSVDQIDEIPDKVEWLLSTDSNEGVSRQFERAKMFDKDRLRKRWVEAFDRVFSKSKPEKTKNDIIEADLEKSEHSKFYDQNYFDSQSKGSLESARSVIPHVLGLHDVKSVIDVGCGVAPWASVYSENGVETVWGIDGGYVDEIQLMIPKKNFVARNLEAENFDVDRKFDLANCLEVAEHLPESRADSFVQELTNLAPVILFSAAIPGQSGRNHINEQWQSYWVRLFNKYGYGCLDSLRPKIWNDGSVKHWYRQNAFLAVKGVDNDKDAEMFDVVHPKQFERNCQKLEKVRGEVKKLKSKK